MGKLDASELSRMSPLALHTNTSIWPGVSIRICSMGFCSAGAGAVVGAAAGAAAGGGGGGGGAVRFSSRARIWSIFVANRFREVRMPPLGPRLYCFITSL